MISFTVDLNKPLAVPLEIVERLIDVEEKLAQAELNKSQSDSIRKPNKAKPKPKTPEVKVEEENPIEVNAKEWEKKYFNDIKKSIPKTVDSLPYKLFFCCFYDRYSNGETKPDSKLTEKYEKFFKEISTMKLESLSELGGFLLKKKFPALEELQTIRQNHYDTHINEEFEEEFRPTREMCRGYCANGRPNEVLPKIPRPSLKHIETFHKKWRTLVNEDELFETVDKLLDKIEDLKFGRKWSWIYNENSIKYLLGDIVDQLETPEEVRGYIEIVLYLNNYTVDFFQNGVEYELEYNLDGLKGITEITNNHYGNPTYRREEAARINSYKPVVSF